MNDQNGGGEEPQAVSEGPDVADVVGAGSTGSDAGLGAAVQEVSNASGAPVGNPMRRKIAICGTAEPHWRHAPFTDPSWEIWTCGGIFAVAPRINRHFEIHDKKETCKGWGNPAEEEAQRNVYWNWLAAQGDKVYLKTVLPETPNATPFPIEALCQMFPDKYFTNSVSYMIALAIAEGVDEIGLWGIDMALGGSEDNPDGDEYGRQRPSVEYYLGIATGMGIAVHLPPETTLLQSRKLYGFDGPVDDGFVRAAQAKIEELTSRKNEIQKFIKIKKMEIEQAEKDLTGATWAIDVAGYFRRNMER
jgi:hypothetical protein